MAEDLNEENLARLIAEGRVSGAFRSFSDLSQQELRVIADDLTLAIVTPELQKIMADYSEASEEPIREFPLDFQNGTELR